jgi:hypothetical protein
MLDVAMGNRMGRVLGGVIVLALAGYFFWSVLLKPMLDFGAESRVRSNEIDRAARGEK